MLLSLEMTPAAARCYSVQWLSGSRKPFKTPHVSTFDAYVKAVRAAGLRVSFPSPFLAQVLRDVR